MDHSGNYEGTGFIVAGGRAVFEKPGFFRDVHYEGLHSELHSCRGEGGFRRRNTMKPLNCAKWSFIEGKYQKTAKFMQNRLHSCRGEGGFRRGQNYEAALMQLQRLSSFIVAGVRAVLVGAKL